MSLIDDEPRSAHAIANTDVDLMVIDRSDFEKLLSEDKELAYKLLWSLVRTLSQRLRETNEKIKSFFASTTQSLLFLFPASIAAVIFSQFKPHEWHLRCNGKTSKTLSSMSSTSLFISFLALITW